MRAPKTTTSDAAEAGLTEAAPPAAPSRRTFLKVSAAGAGALVIGTYLPFLRDSGAAAAVGIR